MTSSPGQGTLGGISSSSFLHLNNGFHKMQSKKNELPKKHPVYYIMWITGGKYAIN